ncbi:hypothetical protein OG349_13150 [Streptomyces sp. NBC_01317]|uniref:hypothetical protein n=1 Tax=Streptomyces sp. NBC_01317 TaxID=2903822 RepID=UPI002E14658F|nr:hypothetical protein OG349_13150 [Streptomyces sp. NBC_01317]
MNDPTQAEELRHALDGYARAVAPTPAPTGAILDAVRRRRIRRRAGGVAACGAALTAVTLLLTAPADTSGTVRPLPAGPVTGATPSPTGKGVVKVVAPLEKVKVSAKLTVWLTKDGRQCSRLVRFDSCDTYTTDKPSVGLVQASTEGSSEESARQHWIGEFTARGVARMVVRDAGRTYEGTVVTLAGDPGWGAWYADVKPSARIPRSLTLYDDAGNVLARKDLTK